VHDEKDHCPRNSTEEGRQIGCNDEQSESAFDSIRASIEAGSNVNEQSERQPQKEPERRISILRDNGTVGADPKYRINEVPSKSSKKLFETGKRQFPSSTVSFEIRVPVKADPEMTCSEAGRQIDSNDEQ
jgi:hypothetical protein